MRLVIVGNPLEGLLDVVVTHTRCARHTECPTDRKSLLALWGGGPESEAESGRFHGRRVTKVGPEVKHGPEGAALRSIFRDSYPQFQARAA